MQKAEELELTFAAIDSLKDQIQHNRIFTSDEMLDLMDDLISGVTDSLNVSQLARLLQKYQITVYPLSPKRYQHEVDGKQIPLAMSDFAKWLDDFDDLLPNQA